MFFHDSPGVIQLCTGLSSTGHVRHVEVSSFGYPLPSGSSPPIRASYRKRLSPLSLHECHQFISHVVPPVRKQAREEFGRGAVSLHHARIRFRRRMSPNNDVAALLENVQNAFLIHDAPQASQRHAQPGNLLDQPRRRFEKRRLDVPAHAPNSRLFALETPSFLQLLGKHHNFHLPPAPPLCRKIRSGASERPHPGPLFFS